MKRKLLATICLLSALNTITPTYASEYLGYNQMMSGTDLPTVNCQILKTNVDALFYKGQSYISLKDIEKINLKGYDPIKVSYSQNITGSLYDFISFDIPIKQNGKLIFHVKGELNKDINPSHWILYLVSEGSCYKYTINNVTDFIIQEKDKIYIPLHYLRDVCNIRVDWVGREEGIIISGENTIRTMLTPMNGTEGVKSEGEYAQLLEQEKNRFEIQNTTLWASEYDKLTTDYERLHQSKSGYSLMMQDQKNCLLAVYDNLPNVSNEERYKIFMYNLRITQLWLSAIANSPTEAYKQRTTIFDDKGLIVPYKTVVEASSAAEDMYESSEDYVRACAKYFEVLCDKLPQT